MKKYRINIIVACDKNRVIGIKNKLPWNIPDDMKRFKKLTYGHPVLMGRKTWESIPKKFRPLPKRTNIIITRDDSYLAKGGITAKNMRSALKIAKSKTGSNEIFIIGGGQIYKEGLILADRLYITEIEIKSQGDTFFPEYKSIFRKEVSRENRVYKKLKYKFRVLEK